MKKFLGKDGGEGEAPRDVKSTTSRANKEDNKGEESAAPKRAQ